jgi:penicillin-binding protein-related factor A (putative recombinase)
MSLKKSIGGKIAKVSGERFERLISSVAAHERIACVQIPAGSRTVRGPGGQLVNIGQRSPFDFILAYQGLAAFFDTKSTEACTFGASMIKNHQLYALQKLEDQGMVAGYLILFDRQNAGFVRWVPAHVLASKRKGESVSVKDGWGLGTQFSLSLRPIFKL